MPLGDRLRVFDRYASLVDARLRNPRWVIEHLTAASLQGAGSRGNSQFVEDEGIEPRFRARLSDYRGSGYDRGHMAPASNHKASQQAMDATFTLSNTCPQVGEGFNRDYWARFERWVQSCTKQYDDVWVVTGPLYLPRPVAPGAKDWVMQHPMLGQAPHLMAVPTHFFKLILAEKKETGGKKSTVAAAAFVMPNCPIAESDPMTAYAVPLSALEEAAGLVFFPKLIGDAERGTVDAAALLWQARGRKALLQGGEKHQPVLLEGPVSRNALPPAKGKAAAGRPTTPIGHVCDSVSCVLPAKEFWKTTKTVKNPRSSKSLGA